MSLNNRALRGSLLLGTGVSLFIAAGGASAQAMSEVVTVTGYRASLESAINVKRTSAEMVDAINAEDVAKMPDANLAESLQRLPGVSITRDNGEGRQIVVRGLGADFTRVTINGMEALSTVSGTLSQDTPNRTRRFDFNTFASELFNSLRVQKTPSASTDEGSLGATVALNTGRPLDMGDRFVVSLNNAVYERGAAFNPRVMGLASKTFFGGKVGALFSVAYTMRRQALDYISDGAGGVVYAVNGTTSGAFAGTPSGHLLTRDGFAAPAGTSCSGNDGVIPGVAVTNAAYCALLAGSNAATYNLINNPRGHDASTTTVNGISLWQTQAPSDILGGAALAHQNLYQTRIGLTGALQWQVDDDTMIALDGLFSSFYQDSKSQLVTNLGLQRNNTNAILNTANASSSMSSVMGSCTVYQETDIRAANTCGWAHNLLPLDYFTTPTSPGYKASDPNGMGWALSILGRPAMRLVDGHVTDGIVDYLKTDNNDIRTSTDANLSTTQFSQVTLSATHKFNSRLTWDAMFGASASRMRGNGLFVSMEALDKSAANGNGSYIYDIRGDGMKPKEIGFGFDVASPANWDLIKYYSAIRHFLYITDHKYTNISSNVSYKPLNAMELRFGFQQRTYSMNTSRGFRVVSDGFNPSLQELGVTPDKVMRSVNFDAAALSLGGTTPTTFAVPDLDKMNNLFKWECNCLNDYGDWRSSIKNSTGSTNNITQAYGVSERDMSYYLEASVEDIDLGIGTLRGNIGVRYATTSVHSNGYSLNGYRTAAYNSYDDILPSLNLVFAPTDDMMIRFGMSKVLSRPDLTSMAPTISSVTISSTANTGGSLSAGNPYLKPFRANALDLSYEWYFAKGSLISVAGFAKFLKSNPQSQTVSDHLGNLITADMFNALDANLPRNPDGTYTVTGQIQHDNLFNNSLYYNFTSMQDAPGGALRGIEISYQQQLDFLPDPFDGLGLNVNYTVISSKIHYLFRDIGSTNLVDHIGPWLGASPTSINATVYYTANKWEARLSAAYRTKYVDSWPVRAGTYAVGYGNSPAITDFVYGKSSLYVDASGHYDFSDNLSFKVDAMNLLNQHNIKYWLVQNRTEKQTYDSVSGRQFFVGVTYKY